MKTVRALPWAGFGAGTGAGPETAGAPVLVAED
jgi:hypothetical protein